MENEKPIKVLLHERLRSMRQACNLTQQQVADALGLDRSTYTYYERGRSQPNLDILGSICTVFNVSLSDLLEANGLPYSVDDSGECNLPAEAACKLNSLSSDEQSLILCFRRLTSKQRKEMLTSMLTGIPAAVQCDRGKRAKSQNKK